MGSLNSFAVWGSLAALGVAIPILIHLLYRKQRKETPWAAMELLRKALVDRSGQVRLEDYLILALRCLALALIAFALLRPTLSGNSEAWLGEQRVGMVVGIDASFSMSHGEFSRFEKAVARAKQILASANEGDPITLALVSEQTEVLLRTTGYDPTRFEQVLDTQAKPTAYRLGLEQNIEQMAQLVQELKTPVKECYLITDAQESDWAALSDRSRQILDQLSRDATLFVIPVEVENESNLSIVDFSYTSGSLRQSEVARFTATVRNDSRQAADGRQIEFFVNEALVARQAVGRLEPGESRGLSFFPSFGQAGHVRLKAQLSRDELAIDNVRYAVAAIRSQVRVLCVEPGGTDSDVAVAPDVRTGAYYAERALRLRGRGEESPLQVVRVDAPDLSAERFVDFDLIVLADVDDLSPETAARLRSFVSQGGGLMIFLGQNIDAARYNSRFGTGDEGLLPGELAETVSIEDGAEGWPLRAAPTGHRLSGIVERLPEELSDSARFRKFVRVKPSALSQTVLTVAHQDSPLLVEKRIGDGAVLLFTSTADRSWSDFAVHPLYAMLLQQAATQLTSHPDSRQAVVGQPVHLPAPGRVAGSVASLTGPSGETTDVRVTQLQNRPVCAVNATTPGIYTVPAAGQLPGASVAANIHPVESNVRIVDAAALRTVLTPAGVKVIADQSSLASAIRESRQGRELTWTLIIAGIVVFLIQALLARYFTNRQSQGQEDISESLQLARVAAARRA